ncbi:E3 ubiquitin-protein ligase MIB2-like isoform X3 [Anneissia japonica]|uniref:E3 ubiquitin-protein ligase MIB2-like isoform X3 n=1 Tax=Anneissia japonica TaxID=1529436 RepID=UPI001425B7D3|nr:E3 ubiquitin-protein ligase MIB2-like isoform X3 [Anneissia japonica]
MEVGLRVVRGPNWKWGNQDDGEGHVGTVVEIGCAGSTTSPDKTVVVQWDCGTRTNYRTGYQGCYDLLIYDNAPVGIKHPNIICNVCKKHGIQGTRWKCSDCHDYDLCFLCYMNDKHDLNHSFLRFVTQHSVGVRMPKRQGGTKVQSRGLFPGAKVARGPDWDWNHQDGGEGKHGKINDIRGWDNESGRSVANVTWSAGTTNVYRIGHKGKVDLKYIQDGPGGYYYKDHLPRLGEKLELSPTTTEGKKNTFNVGDKVKVVLQQDILKAMQEGHGGWNPKMAEYIGKIGVVHRVTERGDIRVQYHSSGTRWTFHAGALIKVELYSIGDVVRVSDDVSKVKQLQAGHGEWTENMRVIIGKVGKVIRIYSDGDLRVSIDSAPWTLNPACVVPVSQSRTDLNNTMAPEREDDKGHMQALIDQIVSVSLGSESCDKLVSDAAHGNARAVTDILAKHPDWVDAKNTGKTALQVASHQGHVEVIKVLVVAKANLELKDQDGDTALHYAVFGNQPEVASFLLSKGANVDAVNNVSCSSLHVAVNKGFTRCVRILLTHKCDINKQDSYGDSALHDAVAKNNKEIIEMLIGFPTVDLTVKNKKGFNALHHAALKGNKFAADKLLLKARQLADVKKDDGFASLHLAALNGHRDVADILITKGHCEVDIRNNRQQTPLILAVSQGHTNIIELLVTKGADVNSEDEDGDTALHLALMRQALSSATELAPSASKISSSSSSMKRLHKIQASLQEDNLDHRLSTVVACYLIYEGANPLHKNHKNKTPLDMINDQKVSKSIKKFMDSKSRSSRTESDQRPTSSRPHSLSNGKQAQPVAQRAKSQHLRSPSTLSNLSEIMTQCRMCSTTANCMFQPCGHIMACMECAGLFQKCYTCKADIKQRVRVEGGEIKCCSCHNNLAEVTFQPCGHRILCQDCASKTKTCSTCQSTITQRIGKDGTPANKADAVDTAAVSSSAPETYEEMRKLKEKVREIEESTLCLICMENKRNVVFLCGHGTCKKCAKPLKHCPMCRKPITKKIQMFTG